MCQLTFPSPVNNVNPKGHSDPVNDLSVNALTLISTVLLCKRLLNTGYLSALGGSFVLVTLSRLCWSHGILDTDCCSCRRHRLLFVVVKCSLMRLTLNYIFCVCNYSHLRLLCHCKSVTNEMHAQHYVAASVYNAVNSFPHCVTLGWKSLLCQREACLNSGNVSAVKVCMITTMSPSYIIVIKECIECVCQNMNINKKCRQCGDSTGLVQFSFVERNDKLYCRHMWYMQSVVIVDVRGCDGGVGVQG